MTIKQNNRFVLKPFLQQVSSCMHKSSIYHYITPTGKFKSAAIIQLDKEIGQELSKVLLLFQVSNIDREVPEKNPLTPFLRRFINGPKQRPLIMEVSLYGCSGVWLVCIQ